MSALFLSMFTLGLVTSVHCVSMCGPMVVTYAVKGEEDGPWFRKIVPNVAYQIAKITSYVFVGLLLGAIGGAFNLDGVRPYVMLAAGAFMIVLGLGMTGRVSWAQRLTPRPPKFLMTALSRTRRKATADAAAGSSSLATPLTFGLLTGLFPCAPLQGAQLTAAATGSALTGGMAMLAFGLGTAPLMLGFGTASSFIPKTWKHRMTLVLAVVVMVFGLVFINRGLMLVGSPVTAQSVRQAVLGGPAVPATAPAESAAQYKTGSDGVVEVPLTIRNTQFLPAQLEIPADKPVRLIVDRQEDNACSAQIAIPQLGILKDLKPFGTTVVDVPATASGNYTLTCGMGMMSGRLLVGAAAAGGASAASSPMRFLALGLVAALVGLGLLFARQRRPKTAPAASSAGAQATKRPAAGVLGLSPAEVLVGAGVLTAAIVAGLALGGMFTR